MFKKLSKKEKQFKLRQFEYIKRATLECIARDEEVKENLIDIDYYHKIINLDYDRNGNLVMSMDERRANDKSSGKIIDRKKINSEDKDFDYLRVLGNEMTFEEMVARTGSDLIPAEMVLPENRILYDPEYFE